jgi:hypothetical protein
MLLGDVMFDEIAGQGGGAVAAELKTKALSARVTKVGWTLPLTGRPELALMWKGSMDTIRGIGGKSWRYLVPALVGLSGLSFGIVQANRMRGPAAAVSIVVRTELGERTIEGYSTSYVVADFNGSNFRSRG